MSAAVDLETKGGCGISRASEDLKIDGEAVALADEDLVGENG